jgi:hypothetical protein
MSRLSLREAHARFGHRNPSHQTPGCDARSNASHVTQAEPKRWMLAVSLSQKHAALCQPLPKIPKGKG